MKGLEEPVTDEGLAHAPTLIPIQAKINPTAATSATAAAPILGPNKSSIETFYRDITATGFDESKLLETYKTRVDILKESIDTEGSRVRGSSFLHLAVNLGLSKFVQFFLKECLADPNITNTKKETPLHLASENSGKEYLTIIKDLCESKANITAKNTSGETPLSIALKRGLDNNAIILVSHFLSTKHVDKESVEIMSCLIENCKAPLLAKMLFGNSLDEQTSKALFEKLNYYAGALDENKKKEAFKKLKDAEGAAEEQRKAAEEQHKAAEEQHKAAEEQHKAAEEQRKAAEEQRKAAEEQKKKEDKGPEMLQELRTGIIQLRKSGPYKDFLIYIDRCDPTLFKSRGAFTQTPLHLAIEDGHFSVAKAMIDKCKEALSVKNNKDISPLQSAYTIISQQHLEEKQMNNLFELIHLMLETNNSPLKTRDEFFEALKRGGCELLDSKLAKFSSCLDEKYGKESTVDRNLAENSSTPAPAVTPTVIPTQVAAPDPAPAVTPTQTATAPAVTPTVIPTQVAAPDPTPAVTPTQTATAPAVTPTVIPTQVAAPDPTPEVTPTQAAPAAGKALTPTAALNPSKVKSTNSVAGTTSAAASNTIAAKAKAAGAVTPTTSTTSDSKSKLLEAKKAAREKGLKPPRK